MDLGTANYLMISFGIAVIALAVAATLHAQLRQVKERVTHLEIAVERLQEEAEQRHGEGSS
jgi:UDP-N-acetylmuramyl pentapeptide synthase